MSDFVNELLEPDEAAKRNFDPVAALVEDIETVLGRFRERITRLEEMAKKVPAEIASRDDAAALADGLRMIAACLQALDQERTRIKRPHMAASKTVDARFSEALDRLEQFQEILRPRLCAWVQAEAARGGDLPVRGTYGGRASLSAAIGLMSWDRGTIDLEALRQDIDADCIEKAIRKQIKRGVESITGAEIGEIKTLVVS
jgi:hypothetical protein